MPIALRFPIALVLPIVCLAVPAWADFRAGLQTHDRGDYVTALREWRPGRVGLVVADMLAVLVLLFWVVPESNAGRMITLNLQHQVFATKPMQEYKGHYWFESPGAHLEGADLSYTVLARSTLRRTFLQNANLELTNLKEDDLQGVDLRRTYLQKADLRLADLRGVDLRGAHLQEADLRGAHMQEADLRGANLQEAHLRTAKNLTVEQLSTVKALYRANLYPPMREAIKMDYPHLLEKP